MSQKNEIIEQFTGDMVTIDELLKDEPKALEDLKELRKWMDENPDILNFPEEKVTQGSRKMKQILEDARRDKKFQDGVAKCAINHPKYSHADLEKLYAIYRFYLKTLESFRKKFIYTDENYKLKKSLCRNYGIDPQLFNTLQRDAMVDRLEGWDFSETTSGDVCSVEPQKDTDEPVDMHTYHLTTVDDIRSEVYPVKIRLHRFASKRDVLDFIDKQWDEIAPYLAEKRTRERKIERHFADFIWKNRELKAQEIKKLIDKKFPKNGLIYSEISKIISEEKKRRGHKEKK